MGMYTCRVSAVAPDRCCPSLHIPCKHYSAAGQRRERGVR